MYQTVNNIKREKILYSLHCEKITLALGDFVLTF